MNSKIILLILMLASSLSQAQQTGGGTTGGGTAPGAPSGTQATPETRGTQTPQQPAGQPPATPTPNQQTTLNQVPAAISTNAAGLPVRVDTNQFQADPSNRILTPTGSTNGVFGTNASILGTNIFSATNNTGFILRDSALTPADRSLVIQIRETIRPQLQAAGPWSPLSFMVRSSVVTIVGFVPTVELRTQIESGVRATPGVVGVINSLRVVNQDEAVSPSDRAVLLQIRQAIQPLQSSIATTPLHFVIRNGNVTIVGLVPSAALRQQIETAVTQVPGVIAIVNRSGEGAMTVNAASPPSAESANSAPGVTIVPPSPLLVPAASGAVATNQFGTGQPLTPTGLPVGRTTTNAVPAARPNPAVPTVPAVPPAPPAQAPTNAVRP